MLKQRILTAIVLVPLLLAALFYLSISWIALIFGLFIAAAAWEWAGLSGLRSHGARIAYVICLVLFGVLGMNVIPLQQDLIVSLLATAVLWWLWALVELISR